MPYPFQSLHYLSTPYQALFNAIGDSPYQSLLGRTRVDAIWLAGLFIVMLASVSILRWRSWSKSRSADVGSTSSPSEQESGASSEMKDSSEQVVKEPDGQPQAISQPQPETAKPRRGEGWMQRGLDFFTR